jgi:hypothetical protein
VIKPPHYLFFELWKVVDFFIEHGEVELLDILQAVAKTRELWYLVINELLVRERDKKGSSIWIVGKLLLQAKEHFLQENLDTELPLHSVEDVCFVGFIF